MSWGGVVWMDGWVVSRVLLNSRPHEMGGVTMWIYAGGTKRRSKRRNMWDGDNVCS